ncbi:MAG: ABC transporter ATP-binding protein [Myxococcales bacterium]|nr:ABC transporter ATP-binding protein [Myxococcales bacterium]
MRDEEEPAKTLIRVEGVGKTYQRGRERLQVLKDLSLNIREGAYEALMGPSGSGKSTLLNLIAGLDNPSEGRVLVDGTDLGAMGEGKRAAWRAANVGFIFQTYNLMPVLTALENVELPLLLTKLGKSERKRRAQTALKVVGLEDRASHRPDQLSGGQQQRVAIARAIVTDPKILPIVTDPRIVVADEPTGDLDRQSADEILELLEKLNTDFGKTILMVTHDPAAADRAQVIHQLDKGALASQAAPS